MKTTFFTLAALLLTAAGSFYACQEKEAEESNEPVVISFTEYSLIGTSCQWANLSYDNKVIVINNSTALESYLTGTRSSYPAIDFSKHSLLLASGTADNAVFDISAKDLQQLVSKDYELSIEIILNPAIVNGQWVFALLTDKLNGDKKIELNASYKNCEDCDDGNDYPIDIPFEEYSLAGTACQWANLNYDDKVIVINSSAALEGYLTGSGYPPIDFSKQTLLLISGTAEKGVFDISAKSLQQLSANDYALKIEIGLIMAASTKTWTIALLISKLDIERSVELNVVYKDYTIEDILTEGSVWKCTGYNKLPVIKIPEDNGISLELIFYPAENKTHLTSICEEIPPVQPAHMMPLCVDGIIDYKIEIVYPETSHEYTRLSFNYVQYTGYDFWVPWMITVLSKNEIYLKYAGGINMAGTYVVDYYFARQID